MESYSDLPDTPSDANVTISFVHLFPTNQWHLEKDGTTYTNERHPVSIRIDIELLGEFEWMFYIDLCVEYIGFLGQECRFGFNVLGCTESLLYNPRFMHSLLHSSTVQFYVFINQYAINNNIINLPVQNNFTEEDIAMISSQFIESAEKKGFITFGDENMLELNLEVTKDMLSYLTVFKTTAEIVNIIFYNSNLNTSNNIAQISKFIDMGRVNTIMHKCTFKYKNESVELSTADTLNLLILIDLSLQCVVGQIWYRIKPFMHDFTDADEIDFLKQGHLLITSFMEGLGNPKFDNLLNPADWDSLLA